MNLKINYQFVGEKLAKVAFGAFQGIIVALMLNFLGTNADTCIGILQGFIAKATADM